MVITCSTCSKSLQIDEKKATSERFSIRCPKCQNVISIDLKNSATSAMVEQRRDWDTSPAIPFQKNTKSPEESANLIDNTNLEPLLTAVLGQQMNALTNIKNNDVHRRVLLCLGPERSKATAKLLDEAGYSVFLADNPTQATEKIRDAEVDIVIFSPDFAIKLSGASALLQTINALRMEERRRLFVVLIEENLRTFDTHAAFMRNLNLIVQTNDLNRLPSILQRALRNFNEIYRYFNHALTEI